MSKAQPIGLLAATLLCLASCGHREQAVATAPTKVTVTKSGPVAPANAPGQSLYLVRYEIAPQTKLVPHYHEGTQIGLVVSGELTYHVLTGEVPVYRPGPDGEALLLRTLKPGSVSTVAAGEWLIEEPEDHHWGENEGSEPLVIYTSSLLRQGAPLATPDPP